MNTLRYAYTRLISISVDVHYVLFGHKQFFFNMCELLTVMFHSELCVNIQRRDDCILYLRAHVSQSILKSGDILHVSNMAVCARRCD